MDTNSSLPEFSWRHAVQLNRKLNNKKELARELLEEWGNARGLSVLRRNLYPDDLWADVKDYGNNFLFGMEFTGEKKPVGSSRLTGRGRKGSETLGGHEEYFPLKDFIVTGQKGNTVPTQVTQEKLDSE